MILRFISLAFAVLISVIAVKGRAENEEENSTNSTEKYGAKKVGIQRRIYGGKTLEDPPETLIVTEEIWFDIQIQDYDGLGQDYRGRFTIGCFGKLTPITCMNFISLAKGYKKGRLILSYRGTTVATVVRDFMVQLGDVQTKYGNSESIFGVKFYDESFAISHNHAGWVGMANSGPDSNGSQFYIILRTARWLDGKHVIFGKVIQGMDVIETIGREETGPLNVPLRKIVIEKSGINRIKSPYVLTSEQFNTDLDIDNRTKQEL
ncbi:peptidyl-prolyl cis-trans isomerase B [Biomphalaria pfeifferi]|uniref:Peptidyl-prolyl cis-trans isomerase n=1 Tax=Biomphalaria pfeifferi TaxID=112525 RepID=A0AAD8F277_BIOPF|nr:peptidyl-prolyl cis-trans isomerase B [Biomphalaria pfeifferi]